MPKQAEDLTGKKFGKWTVLGRSLSQPRSKVIYWACRCDCGTEKDVQGSSLKNERHGSRSCGCAVRKKIGSKEDLTGKSFGRLTVIEKAGLQGKYQMWMCRCECGNSLRTMGVSLRNGRTRSCGCLQRDTKRLKEPGEAGFRVLFDRYVRGAKARDLKFQLTEEEFRAITRQSCAYCGASPDGTVHPPRIDQEDKYGTRAFGAYKGNGVDRYDNSKGYVPGNAVPCCSLCNFAKHKLSGNEFVALAEKIYSHRRESKGFGEALVTIEHIRNGKVIDREQHVNLITNTGRIFAHQQTYSPSGLGTVGLCYIGLSNDTLTETAASTTLSNEITTNGLGRALGTVTLPTGSGNQTTVQRVFTASGTVSCQKAALFTAASGGTISHILSFSQKTLGAGDQLTVTFTITLG